MLLGELLTQTRRDYSVDIVGLLIVRMIGTMHGITRNGRTIRTLTKTEIAKRQLFVLEGGVIAGEMKSSRCLQWLEDPTMETSK